MSVLSDFRSRMNSAGRPQGYVIHYWTEGTGAAGYDEWEVPDTQFATMTAALYWLSGHTARFMDAVSVQVVPVYVTGESVVVLNPSSNTDPEGGYRGSRLPDPGSASDR